MQNWKGRTRSKLVFDSGKHVNVGTISAFLHPLDVDRASPPPWDNSLSCEARDRTVELCTKLCTVSFISESGVESDGDGCSMASHSLD